MLSMVRLPFNPKAIGANRSNSIFHTFMALKELSAQRTNVKAKGRSAQQYGTQPNSLIKMFFMKALQGTGQGSALTELNKVRKMATKPKKGKKTLKAKGTRGTKAGRPRVSATGSRKGRNGRKSV